MAKIILEDRFLGFQKIHALLVVGIPALIMLYVSGEHWLNAQKYQPYGNSDADLTLAIICILTIFGTLVFIFTKRGFIKIKDSLYRGLFFRGILIMKKRIDLSKAPSVTVLHLKKVQKLGWISDASPDMSTKYKTYEINLLNERHTRRNPIMMLNKKENVEPTLNFLTTNFNLRPEKYRSMYRKK